MPDPSLPNRLLTLMRDLASITHADRVKWTTTDRSQQSFSLSRPQGTVTVFSIDGDGTPPYGFVMYDPDGIQLEEILEDAHQSGTYDAALARLFQAARANALNITATLDAWTADLDKLAPTPHDDEPF